MTFQEALTAEIGDILVSQFNFTQYQKGDEVILVERARDYNEQENDTGGWFYHRTRKVCVGGNIQDFQFKQTTI